MKLKRRLLRGREFTVSIARSSVAWAIACSSLHACSYELELGYPRDYRDHGNISYCREK